MTAPRKWIFLWTALGLIFDLRWIPSFNNLLTEVTWSNVPWIIFFSIPFLLMLCAGGKLCQILLQRTCRRSPLWFNPYRLDIFKTRLYIRWFYLGGTGHYLSLLIILFRPADLLLLWLNLAFLGLAVLDSRLDKALKLEFPPD